MKTWRVIVDPVAAKELKRLGHQDRQRIELFIDERIATAEDPRRLGHALAGRFAGLWSYRVDDLRLIVSIQDECVTVLVLKIGTRRDIYR